MELKEIISISGKPGLFRLAGKNSKPPIIVENLETKKRTPLFGRDPIISLSEISIYTETGDKPLGEVFESIREITKGDTVDLKPLLESSDTLRNYMAEVLPDYDRERVRENDMRKLFKWYNTLTKAGMRTFVSEKPSEDSNGEAQE